MGKSLEIGFDFAYPAIEDCRDFHPSPGINDATRHPTLSARPTNSHTPLSVAKLPTLGNDIYHLTRVAEV